MTSSKRIAAAVAATLSLGAAAAFAVEPQDARIQQLETKIAQLEAKTAASQKDVANTIEQVLRDAEKRSQLLATSGGTVAGYDNGFFISSGDFRLQPIVNFQFRNITDYREETAGAKDDEIENGFEVARLEFALVGTAFTKDLTYAFMWDTQTEGGSLVLLDAWVKYMFSDDMGFRVGQFNDPVTHENLLDDWKLLAVDRSLLDVALGGGFLDRVQGATFVYGNYNKNNPLNLEIGLHDGANSDNTDYTGHLGNPGTIGITGAPASHAFDFGIAGRVEYKAMGDWNDYADFQAMNNKENLLVLGAGIDWSQGGDGDVITGTIDAQFETSNGLGLYGAVIVRHADGEIFSGPSDEADGDSTDWGAMIQANYQLNPSWDIFGRVAYLDFDTDILNDENEFWELTVGVNYYLGKNGSAGHRAKVTIDLNWLPDGSPFQAKDIGYLGDNNGEDEIVLRGQFQLLI